MPPWKRFIISASQELLQQRLTSLDLDPATAIRGAEPSMSPGSRSEALESMMAAGAHCIRLDGASAAGHLLGNFVEHGTHSAHAPDCSAASAGR